jgi:PIN domain nuclease of toxin-antitoxin system
MIDRLSDPRNEILFSAVSGWEISIKKSLGRLLLPRETGSTGAFLSAAISAHQLIVLPITLPAAVAAGELPAHHNDPFDRLLIAQARALKIPVATPDPAFQPYDVETLW